VGVVEFAEKWPGGRRKAPACLIIILTGPAPLPRARAIHDATVTNVEVSAPSATSRPVGPTHRARRRQARCPGSRAAPPGARTRPDRLPAAPPAPRPSPAPLHPPVTQRDLKAEIAPCVGGVISPCLLNVALHGLEEAAGVRYKTSGTRVGEIMPGAPIAIRYADDVVVLCHSQQQAAHVKAQLAGWLAPRGWPSTRTRRRSSASARALISWGSTSAATAPSC